MDWTCPPPDALLAAQDATWPGVERARVGDWIVRRGAGGGRRAASVRPAGDPGLPLAAAVAAAAAIQRGWGETPMVQIGPDDAALDALLDGLGWVRLGESLLMAAPAAALAARGLGGLMAVAVRAPLVILDELWDAGGIGPARRAVMAACAAAKERFLVRANDRPAGAVFVAAADGIAALHALEVAPAFRRQGVGAALVAAAAGWASAQGAETLSLAVSAGNAPAIAFYRRLGFVESGRYHQRRAPESPQESRP